MSFAVSVPVDDFEEGAWSDEGDDEDALAMGSSLTDGPLVPAVPVERILQLTGTGDDDDYSAKASHPHTNHHPG